MRQFWLWLKIRTYGGPVAVHKRESWRYRRAFFARTWVPTWRVRVKLVKPPNVCAECGRRFLLRRDRWMNSCRGCRAAIMEKIMAAAEKAMQ